MNTNITNKNDENIVRILETMDEYGSIHISIDTVNIDISKLTGDSNTSQNIFYLLSLQNYFNDLLRSRYCKGMRRGYVYLYEVCEALGLDIPDRLTCVGWLYDLDEPYGDNYIDFDITSPNNRNFIKENTNEVILNFNHDGNIIDKIYIY